MPSNGGAAAAMSADIVQGFQFIVNDILQEMGYGTIRMDGVTDATVCGAVDFIAKAIGSGARPESGQVFAAALKEPIGNSTFGALLTMSCMGMKPWSVPVKGGAVVGPTKPADVPGTFEVCEFDFGSAHPQVKAMQTDLNAALDAAGYESIAVTGVYDAATCGAVFTLGGSYRPAPSTACPDNWTVPFDCPNKVLPKKKGGETTKTGTSMAWMLGGLVGAAVLTGLYVSMKKK
jgi:hypothetical protein